MVVDVNKDVQIASRIISGLLDESLIEVTPLIGKGSVNKVFIVETVSKKVVVRMSERNDALDEYAKEAWCIERAAARGVLVPPVLSVGRCAGSAFIVQSYIAGDEGRDSHVPRHVIWRELGRFARLIHSISVSGFGLKLSHMTQGEARQMWLKYVDYNLASLDENDPLIKLAVLTQPQSKVIKGVFADLRKREFTFGLNHGDISLKNTIIDVHGGVNLLDWGSAEASIVPHHDLIQILKMNMSEGDPDGEEILSFLGGYRISPAEYERMMPELDGLLVLRAFDKLRWAIEWNPEELDRFVRHARAAVGRILT